MTRPPVTTYVGRSFADDMRLASKMPSAERSLIVAPLTPAVTNASGTASVGVMTTMIDIAASDPALAACAPDWTATLDLTIHGAGRLADGPIVGDCRLVRVGKKVVVVAADVWDGRGIADFDALEAAIDEANLPGDGAASARVASDGPVLAGRGLVTFARLPRTAARDVDDYDPSTWVGQVRRRAVDDQEPPSGPIVEEMGVRALDAERGVLELDLTPYVANSIGTINGGAQAILVEAAAHAMRPGLVATDLEVHYVAQVKVGPARTRGRVSRDAPDHSVVTIELVDAGADDLPLALATVTLQRPATVGDGPGA